MGIAIGPLITRNRVFLAPMSGVSDAPFRVAASRAKAGLVVSEMVASEELARCRRDMVARAKGDAQIHPFCIQLAGREPHWMAEGARIAQDLGADIVDINMGCPARQVTGGLSGAALMRDLDHALTLIEATVRASRIPVTLKMRLGWDALSHNAPELATRAEQAGVALITVHGRTRCQFYSGRADWAAIRAVRECIKIPLIANGDCNSVEDIRQMLALSGADGVMVGRGAYGRPWWPGLLAEGLEAGTGLATLSLSDEYALLCEQHEGMLTLYGASLGNKIARKHLGWAVERKRDAGLCTPQEASAWKQRLQGETDNAKVKQTLKSFYAKLDDFGENSPLSAPLPQAEPETVPAPLSDRIPVKTS